MTARTGDGVGRAALEGALAALIGGAASVGPELCGSAGSCEWRSVAGLRRR